MHPIPLHDILGFLGLIFGFFTLPIWVSFIFAVVSHGFDCLRKHSKGKITIYGASIGYVLYFILCLIDSVKNR